MSGEPHATAAVPPPHAATSSPAWALAAGVAAAACFVCMDSVVKLMAPRYDALQLAFLRFAGGSVFAVLLWSWRRSALPDAAAWRLHGWRSALLVVSIAGYFHALTILPLAQAIGISYLAPIFVSVLAVPLLKERPAPAVWIALLMGAAGVGLSVGPELLAPAGAGSPARLVGMASAAVAALAFSGVMLLARRQASRDSLWTILLVQNLLPLALLAGPAAWRWKPFDADDLLLVGVVGALGTAGLLCLTHAFSKLEASRVAPLEYTSFVWAAGLGYGLFDEVPTVTSAGSAALIVAGCLFLLRR